MKLIYSKGLLFEDVVWIKSIILFSVFYDMLWNIEL